MGLFVGNVCRGTVGAVALSCPLSLGHVGVGRNLNLTSTTSTTQATSSWGRGEPAEHVLTSVSCLNKMRLRGVSSTFKGLDHPIYKKHISSLKGSVCWTPSEHTHIHTFPMLQLHPTYLWVFKTDNLTFTLQATIHQVCRGEEVSRVWTSLSSLVYFSFYTTTFVTFCLRACASIGI